MILKYAHDSSVSLLTAFAEVRKARKARGTPTDEEQDLLRAMVVFAGAGLDSMTKQLVRDALPVLAKDPDARTQIERLGARHLSRSGVTDVDEGVPAQQSLNLQRLARVLMGDSPRDGLLDLIVEDLTAGSLQSAAELHKVVGYLGLKGSDLGVTDGQLKAVFGCRNMLIHEMDIDFTQANRNRFPRKRDDMVAFAKTLLSASGSLLTKVDARLMGIKV